MALGLVAISSAQAQAPTTAPREFAQCGGCHSYQPGRHVFGPSLAGVAGRRAGSVADFTYSDALKASGLTWNAATLDRWLTNPKKLVPGTKMRLWGFSDERKIANLLAYLRQYQ